MTARLRELRVGEGGASLVVPADVADPGPAEAPARRAVGARGPHPHRRGGDAAGAGVALPGAGTLVRAGKGALAAAYEA